MDAKSLLESTINAFPAVTVPGVTPVNLFISDADAVTKVPASSKPTVDPS